MRIFVLILSFICIGLNGCKNEEPARRDPNVGVLLQQSTNALKQHEFHQALALNDSAVQLSPSDPNTHFLRARILSELGRFSEAETEYFKTMELDPNYRGLWNNLANNAFREQEYTKSISLYQKELAANDAAIPWRGLGRTYVELGNVDSAQIAFNKAIAIDSLYAPAYFSLGLLLEDEGELKAALKNARKALNLEPENTEYQYTVGALLVKNGKPDEGAPLLEKVAEKWPWRHGALYNLGQALARLGREDEAQKFLDQAEKVRALDAKIEHLENTVRAVPNDPFAHAQLGVMLRRAGRYNDAMHAYKVALYLAPGNAEIRNNVATLCLIRGDTTQAIGQFRQILTQDSTRVDAWLNLGIVYALSKEFALARDSWEHVLKYQPDNQIARSYLAKLP